MHLPAGVTAGDDKVIGETAYAPGIQKQNIYRLLIAGYLHYLMSYIYRFQN